MNEEEIMQLIRMELATVMGMGVEEIDPEENFLGMGITSLEAIKMLNALKQKLGREDLSPAAVFEYQSVRDLSCYIASVIG